MDRHIGVATPFNNVMHVATIKNKNLRYSKLADYFYTVESYPNIIAREQLQTQQKYIQT